MKTDEKNPVFDIRDTLEIRLHLSKYYTEAFSVLSGDGHI